MAAQLRTADAGSAHRDVAARTLTDMLPSTSVDETGVASRPGLALTPIEQQLVALVPAAVRDLHHAGATSTTMSSSRLLEDILVLRLLERCAQGAAPPSTAGTVLAAMRELSTQREEHRPATSGVVVVGDVPGWLAHAHASSSVIVEPFAVPLTMDHDFFVRPAAHHYVDGHRSLYVVGPDLAVVGLARVLDPGSDPLDVACGRHLDVLLSGPPAWCATVDVNSTIDVVGTGGLHLRRRTSHWRLLDRSILPKCLHRAGLDADDAYTLASALTTMSQRRVGTLVLVPTGDRGPEIAGAIDSSRCGAALLAHMLGRSLADLRRRQALVDVLSCDGLTVIDRSGELALTGVIIALDGDHAVRSGGGRTQAALTASVAGTAVMVSADGQITVFEGGRELVHLER